MKRQRQSEHDLTRSEEIVEIQVGGTADGAMTRDPVGYGNYAQTWENMICVQIQNTGDDQIIDPWVDIDGRHLWRSLGEILDGILTPQLSDRDKALAIWDFARHHRYHATTGDDEVKDTVKMLNVYGYTLCWDEAYTVSNLWQAAGLKIRRGLPHGHCTTEVFYDGAYHLLDSDEHLLVLDRDNETVAGEAEISRDHDLMKRSHAYGILATERRETSESAASLFCHDGPRSGTRPRIGDHEMRLTLRPGERLEWRWDDGGKFHGFGGPPPRSCNGRLHWTVPVKDMRWGEGSGNIRTDTGTLVAEGQATLTYQVESPYVLVGGRLQRQTTGETTWEASRDDGASWELLPATTEGLDLDPLLPPDGPACYGLQIRLRGRDWTLRQLTIDADLQMAPLSLPDLRLGLNRVRYRDRSTQRQVRLCCEWEERDDLPVPRAPTALTHSMGTSFSASCPVFSWDRVDDATDYHIMLGTDPRVTRALSPVFEKLISRTPSAGQSFWAVPEEGLLNPDTDYHWRVRARSDKGVWGPWSDSAHFRLNAPGLPAEGRLEMDWERRRAVLRWQASAAGRPPIAYEIYGSDERGFSARRQPYDMYLGNESEPERQTVPGNLLCRIPASESPHLVVLGADIDETLARPFYRIVAVDGDGRRSGPTHMIEAPRPFITSVPPRQIVAGVSTSIALACLRSGGELRAQSRGPRRYYQCFREAEEVEYLLDEGPAWVSLDPEGHLELSPAATGTLGYHTVTLRARNGHGGLDVLGFDIEVVEALP